MKYSEEMADAIIKGIENGISLKSLYLLLDITKQTFYNWKNNNIDFLDSVKKAELDYINKNLELIQKYGEGHKIKTLNRHGELVEIDVPGDWHALGWKLERGHRGIFSIQQNVDITGKLDVDVIKPEKPKKSKKAKEEK